MPSPKSARSSKPLRVALLGRAFMGRAHASAWARVNQFFQTRRSAVLATIAAADAKGAAAFAETFGFDRSAARWQDAVGDPEVDLVDVATPNDLHAEQALAALLAGKHVACEKPLATTLDDARALRDAARKARGQKTFVWHNYRRCPAIGLAWNLLREGRLGRVRHVRATYLQSWGGPETPMSWRFEKKRAGSGAHGDLNAHLIDLARFLVAEPIVEVYGAAARTFVPTRLDAAKKRRRSDVDDALLFLAAFKGGATASFEASRVAHGHLNDLSIEIDGELGSVAFSLEDLNVLRFCDAADGPRLGGWRRVMATHGGAHPYAAAWWPDGHVLGYEHGFVNMAADILRVLGGEKPELPLPDFEDGYETSRVLEAASMAAEERMPVSLKEVE